MNSSLERYDCKAMVKQEKDGREECRRLTAGTGGNTTELESSPWTLPAAEGHTHLCLPLCTMCTEGGLILCTEVNRGKQRKAYFVCTEAP